ncbi:MAG: hypothetical protein EXR85_00110 [Xanthomonadales bacterium]|nr:hypothetical protein [Xanthomonadales bacterium]
MLVNLQDNAITFTPPHGNVCLTVERRMGPPDNITVTVIDSGPGVDPGRLAVLFEQNAHQLPGGSEVDQGMGLGLKVCREIIQSHQGRITAENLPQGGACMTFTLPLDTSKAPAAEIQGKVSCNNGSAQWGLHA